MGWRSRPWICWALLLATLVAGGPHEHARPIVEACGEFGACDESQSHWAGHPAGAEADHPDACAICQHRQPSAWEPPVPAPAPPKARPLVARASTLIAPAGLPLRRRCRAPPDA